MLLLCRALLSPSPAAGTPGAGRSVSRIAIPTPKYRLGRARLCEADTSTMPQPIKPSGRATPSRGDERHFLQAREIAHAEADVCPWSSAHALGPRFLLRPAYRPLREGASMIRSPSPAVTPRETFSRRASASASDRRTAVATVGIGRTQHWSHRRPFLALILSEGLCAALVRALLSASRRCALRRRIQGSSEWILTSPRSLLALFV